MNRLESDCFKILNIKNIFKPICNLSLLFFILSSSKVFICVICFDHLVYVNCVKCINTTILLEISIPGKNKKWKRSLRFHHYRSLVFSELACAQIFEVNQTFLWCFRSSVFRGCTIPSRVHISANKALSAILWSASGCSWKTAQLCTERLSALATVWSQTITLSFLLARWKLHSATCAGWFPPECLISKSF